MNMEGTSPNVCFFLLGILKDKYLATHHIQPPALQCQKVFVATDISDDIKSQEFLGLHEILVGDNMGDTMRFSWIPNGNSMHLELRSFSPNLLIIKRLRGPKFQGPKQTPEIEDYIHISEDLRTFKIQTKNTCPLLLWIWYKY